MPRPLTPDPVDTLRAAGYSDLAIAAALGALEAGLSIRAASDVLEAAEQQLARPPAIFDALLLEAQQARELQLVKEEVRDVEGV